MGVWIGKYNTNITVKCMEDRTHNYLLVGKDKGLNEQKVKYYLPKHLHHPNTLEQ